MKGTVRIEKSVTRNLGNFESRKETVTMEVPIGASSSYMDDTEKTTEQLRVRVDRQLEKLMNDEPVKPWLEYGSQNYQRCKNAIMSGKYSIADVKKKYDMTPTVESQLNGEIRHAEWFLTPEEMKANEEKRKQEDEAEKKEKEYECYDDQYESNTNTEDED